VVNRFGDFGFILGLFLLFWGLGGCGMSLPNREAELSAECARAAAAHFLG